MDDRKLDKYVLLLHRICRSGVWYPTDDARPCQFSAQALTYFVEHHTGHVQCSRIHPDIARTIAGV